MIGAPHPGFLGIESDKHERHLGFNIAQYPGQFQHCGGSRAVVVGAGAVRHGIEMRPDHHLPVGKAGTRFDGVNVVTRHRVVIPQLGTLEGIDYHRIIAELVKLALQPIAGGVIGIGAGQAAVKSLQAIKLRFQGVLFYQV